MKWHLVNNGTKWAIRRRSWLFGSWVYKSLYNHHIKWHQLFLYEVKTLCFGEEEEVKKLYNTIYPKEE